MFRAGVILVAITWIVAVSGAVGGEVAAHLGISGSLVPNLESLRFAVGWGAVFGLVPCGLAAALITERGPRVADVNAWWFAAWLAIAVASGISFYWMAVIAANI